MMSDRRTTSGQTPQGDWDSGIAGGSARREYERRVANRETDVRGRWGNRLGGLILALNDEPQSTRAWAIGARGEEKLAKALANMAGVRFLNDRSVPGTRGNIDHLVVSRAGVFVVDAKNYSGMIKVRDCGGLFRSDLRLYVGRRDCSSIATNMSWQVKAVEQALRYAGVVPLPRIVPVLCFVDGEWPILFPPSSYLGVHLEGPRSIRKLLAGPGDLTDTEVDQITGLLARLLPSK
jgi:hypothetical protein